MKTFIVIAALFCSTQGFAVQLVPEAQCSGTEQGRAITVTSYVNSQKFCVNTRRDMKSVVSIQDSGLGSAYQASATENATTVKHLSGTGSAKMELQLKFEAETGKLIRNGQTTDLTCFFVQYELEC